MAMAMAMAMAVPLPLRGQISGLLLRVINDTVLILARRDVRVLRGTSRLQRHVPPAQIQFGVPIKLPE